MLLAPGDEAIRHLFCLNRDRSGCFLACFLCAVRCLFEIHHDDHVHVCGDHLFHREDVCHDRDFQDDDRPHRCDVAPVTHGHDAEDRREMTLVVVRQFCDARDGDVIFRGHLNVVSPSRALTGHLADDDVIYDGHAFGHGVPYGCGVLDRVFRESLDYAQTAAVFVKACPAVLVV